MGKRLTTMVIQELDHRLPSGNAGNRAGWPHDLADAKDVRLRPMQEDRRVGLNLAFEVRPVAPT